jgi:hypothetical protein
VLGLGLEELADEGFDASFTAVPEGVFAPRGMLVFWAEGVGEVKNDADELESERVKIAEFEAEPGTREGKRPDEKVEAADESKGEAVGEFAIIPKSALGVTESVEEVVSSGFFELPGVNEG